MSSGSRTATRQLGNWTMITVMGTVYVYRFYEGQNSLPNWSWTGAC